MKWDDPRLVQYEDDIEYVGLAVGHRQNVQRRARKAALAKRKAEIDAEVAEAIKEAEDEIVKRLREVHADGIPATALRDGVFFGNYATWGKYRDLAGIPKEREW